MAEMYYDEHADLAHLRGQTLAVIGYGNQGRAQALNLRDSGIEVLVGVRSDETRAQAVQEGFRVLSIAAAAAAARILLMLIPDEVMPEVFPREILPGLAPAKTLCFASGYPVAFKTVVPPGDLDVVMAAPRMIGAGVRQRFQEGRGFPSFVGVHQDFSGHALQTCLAIARGIGSTKCGALRLSFAAETELDLFTEQAFGPAFGQVLLAAIQTLVDAGYPAEAVLVELILSGEFAYSMQKIVEMGFFRQMELHSHTSQYGSLTRSLRFMEVMSSGVGEAMKGVLAEIRTGSFSREWEAERQAGLPLFRQLQELRHLHPIAEWDRKTREAFRLE